MVVAFLLLFLASGVRIIYFYFQNMALGLQIEKLEASVKDLTAEVTRATTTISEKDAKISELNDQLEELQVQASTVSLTPADLGFAFSANGRRVYGDWVITKSVFQDLVSIQGKTDGMVSFQLDLHVGDFGYEGGYRDMTDWKKEGGTYFVQFNHQWRPVPADIIVEEVALTGGRALIIKGKASEAMDIWPLETVPFVAMVRNDNPGATYKILHFTASEGSGIGATDFRAFVQSISLQ